MVQFTEQVSTPWIHRPSHRILAPGHSQRRTVHRIRVGRHLHQLPGSTVVLFLIQLACRSRIGVPVRSRVTGEVGITVNAAIGLAPARRRGKVIDLVRFVRIGHLHFGKAGELPIVVIGVVIIVLIAPRVAMLAITALLCPDGGHRVLVAPRRADPIGHLRAPRQHDPAPVLVIGCPTQARRRLRSGGITGEGIIAHIAMRVVVRFLPGEIGVPAHPIVQGVQIQPVITLLPQDALCAVEAWDRRGTRAFGVGAKELIDIVLLNGSTVDRAHRRRGVLMQRNSLSNCWICEITEILEFELLFPEMLLSREKMQRIIRKQRERGVDKWGVSLLLAHDHISFLQPSKIGSTPK